MKHYRKDERVQHQLQNVNRKKTPRDTHSKMLFHPQYEHLHVSSTHPNLNRPIYFYVRMHPVLMHTIVQKCPRKKSLEMQIALSTRTISMQIQFQQIQNIMSSEVRLLHVANLHLIAQSAIETLCHDDVNCKLRRCADYELSY